MLALSYAFTGIGVGAILALSGVGLLITYRATGVFNISHGAIAAMAAYLFWEFATVRHHSVVLSAVLVLVLIAPAFGLLIERGVFRSLQRREASAAESLVATIGILVLLVGLMFFCWGGQSREPASLFQDHPIRLGSLIIQSPALIDLGIVLFGTAIIGLVTRFTRFGTEIRAVVDRRDLAELSAIDAGRVSAIAWVTGCVIAALTGILLAPQSSLDPFHLPLLVLETFAVPVIAGLTNIPIAIFAGLAIGVGQSEMFLYSPTSDGAIQAWNAFQANLPVVVLLATLLIRRRLSATKGDAGTAATLALRRSGEPSALKQAGQYSLAAVAMFAPLLFSGNALQDAQQVPALAIIFVSIVAVTGFSGQISLGQAGYAGLGALMFAKFSNNAPELVALLMAVIASAIVGFLTGYPAIRRRGLFLALTTFAVGAFISQFVLEQPYFTTALTVSRPKLFGLSLNGDRAFYVFELLALGVAFFVMTSLQRGPLGRALIAVRDSEVGARSIGIDVPVLKIFIFTVSAGLAGLGGALLAEQARSFDPTTFDPLEGSLFWFAVVIVFGSDSPAGAVVGAAVVVMLDSLFGSSSYILLVGPLAALIGYLPGGAVDIVRRIADAVMEPTALMIRYLRHRPPPQPERQLSDAGQRIAAQVASRLGGGP